MKKKPLNTYEAVKEKALCLLEFRSHSEQELIRKLRMNGASEEHIDMTLSFCREYGFFEISGEDVNSPRQKFACAALAKPEFSHLITSTWALIGHEAISSEKGLDYGMFSDKSVKETPDLYERIEKYAEIGRNFIKNK